MKILEFFWEISEILENFRNFLKFWKITNYNIESGRKIMMFIYRFIPICKKIRLGSSIADPLSLFQCHVAMTVSQYEVLIWSKSHKGTEHMNMVQRSLSHKHARFVGRYTTVVFSFMYLSLSLIEHVIQITTHGQVKTSTCIPILLTRMMLINLKSFPEILN